MEANSHLVPDNCLLRPAPLVSHINLNQGLVHLGSKLSKTEVHGEQGHGKSCLCCPGPPCIYPQQLPVRDKAAELAKQK